MLAQLVPNKTEAGISEAFPADHAGNGLWPYPGLHLCFLLAFGL
jgi:hypothetical protein